MCPAHIEDVWPLYQKLFPSRVTLLRTRPDPLPPCTLIIFATGRDFQVNHDLAVAAAAIPEAAGGDPISEASRDPISEAARGEPLRVEQLTLPPCQRSCRVMHTAAEAANAQQQQREWQRDGSMEGAQHELLGLSPLVYRRHVLPVLPRWPKLGQHYDPRPLVLVVGMSNMYSRAAKSEADFRRLVLSDRVDCALVSRDADPGWRRLHHRLAVHESLEMESLVRLIQSRRSFMFVCSKPGGWYHTDRLTGCIPLALSCDIPLVMDATVAQTYGLPGLVYQRSVMEVLGRLDSYVHTPYATRDDDLETIRSMLRGP